MVDYTKNEDYAAKDALPANDPEKDILGTDVGGEFDEIATAIASKFDTSDIATQAQAEAGTNNTTLMTPLRTAELLGIGSGAGGTAGALPDLLALDDPGDDRILFWDESGDVITWLDVGTHLETTVGGVLNVTESSINHDNLTGFVANEHVDHTTITITAGVGLSYSVGGTDISADATIDLDVNSLTTEETVDTINDMVPFYDASAAVERKIPLGNLVGDKLGQAKYYRSTDISITSTPTLVAFNTVDGTDTLARGTYSTGTGLYTAGADGAVVLVIGHFLIAAQAAGEDGEIQIVKNSTTLQARQLITNRGKFGASSSTQSVATIVSLTNGQTAGVRVANDGTKTGTSGVQNLFINIIELG